MSLVQIELLHNANSSVALNACFDTSDKGQHDLYQ